MCDYYCYLSVSQRLREIITKVLNLIRVISKNGTNILLQQPHFKGSLCVCVDLPRPRKRLTELMLKAVNSEVSGHPGNKSWGFRFFRSPVEVLAGADGKKASGVRLVVNKLEVREQGIFTSDRFIFTCLEYAAVPVTSGGQRFFIGNIVDCGAH